MHARPCVHVALHFHVSVQVENNTASNCPTHGGMVLEGSSEWAEPN